MRTTVDLPDPVYRSLKVRAGLTGVSLKSLIVRLLETGVHTVDTPASGAARPAPPVAIPRTGRPIRALTPRQLRRLEELEDARRNG